MVIVTKHHAKRGKKLLYWDIVLNNYTDEECELVKVVFNKIGNSFVIGKEIGEKGTPHLQCCIKLIKGNYISFVYNKLKEVGLINKDKNCRCSVREGRNMVALVEYCQKGGEIVEMKNVEEFKLEKKISNQEKIRLYINEKVFAEVDRKMKKCLESVYEEESKKMVEWEKYKNKHMRLITDKKWCNYIDYDSEGDSEE